MNFSTILPRGRRQSRGAETRAGGPVVVGGGARGAGGAGGGRYPGPGEPGEGRRRRMPARPDGFDSEPPGGPPGRAPVTALTGDETPGRTASAGRDGG